MHFISNCGSWADFFVLFLCNSSVHSTCLSSSEFLVRRACDFGRAKFTSWSSRPRYHSAPLPSPPTRSFCVSACRSYTYKLPISLPLFAGSPVLCLRLVSSSRAGTDKPAQNLRRLDLYQIFEPRKTTLGCLPFSSQYLPHARR